MPTNYSGRITLILAILVAALWAIFPGVFKGNLKPDLKPGIDMVGGTSLLYEIKPPADGAVALQTNLAEQVMEALKRRVDPDGVRNLVWRPTGSTRLEIQMPLSGKVSDAEEVRSRYLAAQRALDDTNVRPAEVIAAVEDLKGEQREQRLAALAKDSVARKKLFAELVEAYDQIQQARQRQDAAAQAAAENRYDDLKGQIADTNLTPAQVESLLSGKGEKRQERLDQLKKRFEGFPSRVAAIDQFVAAHAAFDKVRNTIDSAAELKRLLRGSGVLEFYILAQPYAYGQRSQTTISPAEYQQMVERLHKEGPVVRAGDTARWFEVARAEEFRGHLTETYNDKVYVLAHTTPDRSMTNREGQPKWALAQAYPIMDQGERKVGFTFNPAGAKLFGDLTGANIGLPLAIVLDGRVISAPNINSQIHGSGEISGGGAGGFAQAEQRYLIATLDAGSLPAQLTDEPISERTVGPQLGADNLRAGLIACGFGLIVVAVFLIGYYYLAGVVAMVAVLLNLVLILALMAIWNATFTLPGVAGIVLTIGMAVDANVLIFERLREEQVRGLSLRMALKNAYDRAFSAILDSNVTTGITAIILYYFGSEEVKGFGLTLVFGLFSSLFTALFVTKTIFGILIEKFAVEKLGSLPLTFPKWDKALRPNIDWMGKAWAFYTFSGVFIAIGLVLFGVRWAQGRVLDTEFTSGTSVQFELKEPMRIEDLRQIVEAKSKQAPEVLPAPNVVSVGNDNKVYEIVTPNNNASQVRDAVTDALNDKLNIRPDAKYDLYDQPAGAAIGKVIFPIERGTRTILGKAPADLRGHEGGAAIVLRNLSQPLTADEIRERIEHQRLQPRAGAQQFSYRDFDVETFDDNRTAIVLISDPAIPHGKDPAKWEQELVQPMWQLIHEAISTPGQLQRVSNFDAQVAGETQRDALFAMALSIIVIMAYIWFRFGNLRYGTATVVALLHDTLFVVAGIGFAHYLANTFIGDALALEAFRINLTMVAAILTVMGWSMNDTVVVFDRVRENRGKFGHISRQIVNESINQTLSRTLLTGSTTILTIFVMYVFGGSGIHGFTFALLVGIVVGTYSSIAIASPLLLWGTAEGGRGAQQPSQRSTPAGQLQRVG